MTDHAELIERLRNSSYRFATETQDEAAIRRNKAAADAASFIAALVAERDRYRGALEDLCNPLEHMRKRSQREGYGGRLGEMAVTISQSQNYLQEIARAALAQGGEK